uniref:Uncharacterized protein n=1 Tax=Panagrolaimus sp. ES5 TaxID=591445 RepID=A0AC34F2G1_9BILA
MFNEDYDVSGDEDYDESDDSFFQHLKMINSCTCHLVNWLIIGVNQKLVVGETKNHRDPSIKDLEDAFMSEGLKCFLKLSEEGYAQRPFAEGGIPGVGEDVYEDYDESGDKDDESLDDEDESGGDDAKSGGKSGGDCVDDGRDEEESGRDGGKACGDGGDDGKADGDDVESGGEGQSLIPSDMVELNELVNKQEEIFKFSSGTRPCFLYLIIRANSKVVLKYGITFNPEGRKSHYKKDEWNNEDWSMILAPLGDRCWSFILDVEGALIRLSKKQQLKDGHKNQNSEKDVGHFSSTYNNLEEIVENDDHAQREWLVVALNQLIKLTLKRNIII